MFESPLGYVVVFAILIVVGLAFYAGRLLFQLKAQRIKQQQQAEKLAAGLKKHDVKVMKSVAIIVQALQEEQCDFSEGCWRLSVLLESLKMTSELEQQFPAIFELYHQIKHMPILEERKKLAKRERMKLDMQRMKSEANLIDAIKQDLALLATYTQEQLTSLES